MQFSHDGIKQKEVVMLMFQVNYQREFFSKMLAFDADSNDDEARVWSGLI